MLSADKVSNSGLTPFDTRRQPRLLLPSRLQENFTLHKPLTRDAHTDIQRDRHTSRHTERQRRGETDRRRDGRTYGVRIRTLNAGKSHQLTAMTSLLMKTDDYDKLLSLASLY